MSSYQFDNCSQASYLAKIISIRDNNHYLYLELRDGKICTINSSQPLPFEVGNIVFVRLEDNIIEPAPDDLWFNDPSVGIVRLKLDDITIVDVSGRLRVIKTNSSIDYEVGYTIEVCENLGVKRIFSKTPVKYLDLPEIDKAVIDKFIFKKDGELLSFDDFGGLESVVGRAKELIELKLENKEALAKINSRPIKGVLFTGDPGSGKTMLAKIIASNIDATFYEISGPQVLSKWYGQSEEVVRKLFRKAKQASPAIIFFDEIDSIASKRDDDTHEASRRVVAQLLTCMDGFTENSNVVVIAATNRPQDIDMALLRPGRFDWEIYFPLPDLYNRKLILKASARKIKTTGNLPHDWVALNTETWSAAELSAIWSEAALLAVAEKRDYIIAEDYIGGYERVFTQKADGSIRNGRSSG